MCRCAHACSCVLEGQEWAQKEHGEERKGEERKGVVLCGHICNTRARLAGSERVTLTQPSWMLSGWDGEVEWGVYHNVDLGGHFATSPWSHFMVYGLL